MFSAVKFVVAGVIVALFGGLVLAGVFTTQQGDEMAPAAVTASPETTSALRITYEPTDDPAVLRVISEPHKKWLKPGNLGPIAIDPDGGVWAHGLVDDDARLFVAQVGVPGRTKFGKMGEFYYWVQDLEFSEDGTLWGASTRVRLRSLDGDTWTAHPLPSGIAAGTEVPDEHAGQEDYGVVDLTLAPDGILYGLSTGKDLVRIADGEVSGRTLGLGGLFDVYHKELDVVGPGHLGPPTALAVTPDGVVWVGGRDPGFVFPSDDHGYLFRHASGSSERVRPLGDDIDPYVADLAVGPDGALWALMQTEDDSYLARYDGQMWSIHSTADGLPAVGAGDGERMDIGADGRVWFTIVGAYDESDSEPPKGEGLAVFDGQEFTRYLVGKDVNDLAIAPDGSVWTSTDDGLYVITPEDVSASGAATGERKEG